MQEVATLEQGAPMDAVRCSPEFVQLLDQGVADPKASGQTKSHPSLGVRDACIEEGGGQETGEEEVCHEAGVMLKQQEYLCARGWRVDLCDIARHALECVGAVEGLQREGACAGYTGDPARTSLVFDLSRSGEELQQVAEQDTKLEGGARSPIPDTSILKDLRKSRAMGGVDRFCSC